MLAGISVNSLSNKLKVERWDSFRMSNGKSVKPQLSKLALYSLDKSELETKYSSRSLPLSVEVCWWFMVRENRGKHRLHQQPQQTPQSACSQSIGCFQSPGSP